MTTATATTTAPAAKTCRCEVDYSTGSFESDRLTVRSPRGGFRDIWLHKRAFESLNPEERAEWRALITRIVTEYRASRELRWEREKRINALAKERSVKSPTDLPEWDEYIRQNLADFGRGMYTFRSDFTAAELRLIDRLSDQRIGRHGQEVAR